MRTYTIEWLEITTVGTFHHENEYKAICAQDALSSWENKYGTRGTRILSVKVR